MRFVELAEKNKKVRLNQRGGGGGLNGETIEQSDKDNSYIHVTMTVSSSNVITII